MRGLHPSDSHANGLNVEVPMTKSEAMTAGLVRFEGKPCFMEGHGAERYSSTGACVACLLGSEDSRSARKDAKAARAAEKVKEMEAFKLLRAAKRRERQILETLKGTNVWRGMALPASKPLTEGDREMLDAYVGGSRALAILVALARLTRSAPDADWEGLVISVLGVPT